MSESLRQYQGSDFEEETENSILVQWTAYLQFLNVLSDYKKTYNFNVNYTEESKNLLQI